MSQRLKHLILIPDSGPDVLIERLKLSGDVGSGAKDEKWLQNLLYRHPKSLPIMEISPSFADLIPICRELRVVANGRTGIIDVLYATPDGRIAILEAKLWRNPESRREVIGQILDYAKDLSEWTYEELDMQVKTARSREGAELTLFDIVRERHPELDETRFYDSVSRSLRRADMLLLIAGDGIRENAGAIARFIENNGTFHFTFGLIEMAIYPMPDGSHLVQPHVLAHTQIIERIVVDVRGGELGESDTEAENGEPNSRPGPNLEEQQELEKQRKKFRGFWEEWLEKYPLDDKSQPIKRPTTWTNQFFDMPKGCGGRIAAVAGDQSGTVGVYLSFPRQPVSDQIYEALLADQDAISDEFEADQRPKWKRDDKFQGASLWYKLGDRLLPEHREEAQKWLGEVVNRFVNSFRPRIDAALREINQS